jgi:NADH-quinone oxidoreductase subunit L
MLLFMGAMGKSAQLLLHTWLPDAMEGPTPVSALIHAATMVTAGVFLVCRMSPIFEYAPFATNFITIIGALTAFFAATVGLVQNDIKRVIAYSTCSQLGYMFVARASAPMVAMFHLFTHAFFKALLFLGAGSVIHAMHHEQDMRRMGGLRKKIPYTYWAMMIGTLALTGFPYLYRLRRLLLQGCHDRKRLRRGGDACPLRLLAARHRGLLHQLLFVAADVPDLPRQAARQAADVMKACA